MLRFLRKAFFPSAYIRPRREIPLEKHLLCMRSLQNLYRLKRKNMREKKAEHSSTLSGGKQSTTLFSFQRHVKKHRKSICLGWKKIKCLTELIKPSSHRKFQWNIPSSYWDILISSYYFGRSENALFTFLSDEVIFKESFLMGTRRYFNVITTSTPRRDVGFFTIAAFKITLTTMLISLKI